MPLTVFQVGEKVNVTCFNPIKLLTKDRWDGNDTDNYLDIICRPDRQFDAPPTKEIPWCKAQCSATKPTPLPEYKIAIDANRTSLTDKLWEDEELWYTCTSETDGIAEWNNATQAMEGTPISEVKFKCNELGKYSLNVDTSGQYVIPKCAERPLRCQCLGGFLKPEHSLRALDSYCRRDPYRIADRPKEVGGRQVYPGMVTSTILF